MVEHRLTGIPPVRDALERASEDPFGVGDGGAHCRGDRFAAVVVHQRPESLATDTQSRQRRLHVAAEAAGVTPVEQQRVDRVAAALAVDHDLQGCETSALLPQLPGERIVVAHHHAADVGHVDARRDERHGLVVVLHRSQQEEVVERAPAAVRVVADDHIVGGEIELVVVEALRRCLLHARKLKRLVDRDDFPVGIEDRAPE